MHFQIPIILAFGAGLASTMALPTTNNSTLEKRAHNGWVGSFNNPTCAGNPDPNGQRPELSDSAFSSPCHAFQFVVGDSVGVNFGTGSLNWEGVTFFSDANCKTVSALNDWKTVIPGSNGMACVQPAPGTVVNSVMGVEDVSSR